MLTMTISIAAVLIGGASLCTALATTAVLEDRPKAERAWIIAAVLMGAAGFLVALVGIPAVLVMEAL